MSNETPSEFSLIRQQLEKFKVEIENMEEHLYKLQDKYRKEVRKRERAEINLDYWQQQAESLPNVQS